MKPAFFTDTHLSKVITTQLRTQGVDMLRCEEVGLEQASDLDLLLYASQTERVMLSCDADFRDLHYQFMLEGREHSGIIHFDPFDHCQNIGRLIKIVLFFHEIVEDRNDWYNKYYEGGALE